MENRLERRATNHYQACAQTVESLTTKTGTGDIKEYSRNSESRDKLRVGDHVRALPYWNQILEEVRDSVPLDIAWWTGAANWWPWPPCTTNSKNYVMHRTLSIQSQWFVAPPTLTLPKVDVVLQERLRNLADTKALGNARRALVNLPMIMKERRETLRMVSGKVASLTKAARSAQARSLDLYRKTAPRNKRALARAAANEHLELVFGWLPVIAEVEGACEYLTQERLDFIRSRGVAVEVSESEITGTRVPTLPITVADAYAQGRTPCRVFDFGQTKTLHGCRTALRYKLLTQIVGDAYKLGFDPLPTAIDMVPLSFMAGWISNFDYWVRTLSPHVGMEFETGSRNFRRHMEYSMVSKVRKHEDAFSYFGGTDVRAHGRITRNDRSVLLSAPTAELAWDFDVGLYEVTAGASLAIQRYLKPLKRIIAQKPFRYRGPKVRDLPPVRYSRP